MAAANQLKVGAEHLPGAAAQLGQQPAIKHKIDPQPLGDRKHPLAVGHLFEHLAHETFAKGHHPLLVARGAKVAPLARIGQQVFVATILALHSGKAEMQIAALQVPTERSNR